MRDSPLPQAVGECQKVPTFSTGLTRDFEEKFDVASIHTRRFIEVRARDRDRLLNNEKAVMLYDMS